MQFESAYPTVPLKTIVEFINGDRSGNYPSARDYTPDGVPFISAADVGEGRVQLASVKRISRSAFNRLRSGQVRPGDLLLCIRGSLGKLGVVSGFAEGAIASSLVIVRSGDPSVVQFLRYFFSGTTGAASFVGLDNGSVQGNISVASLKEMAVPLPPKPIIDAIAAFMGRLDNRIDLLRQTNATLESIAQALFKGWFIDFDPVHAKAEGREPEGMDAATAALFPNSLHEANTSVQREKVADLIARRRVTIGDGYRAKNSELAVSGVYFVRAGDLADGRITPAADRLSEEALSAARSKMAMPGDTVFTSKGTIGRFAFVDATTEPAVYSPQVCFWRSLDASFLQPAYLHFWMKSQRFIAQVDAVRGQAAIMDFVSLSNQRLMVVDVPPAPLQQAFADIVEPMLQKMAGNRARIACLETLRDTLLPRLISGKLRVPEAQEQLQAA